MIELITLLLILLHCVVYFAITFYGNNKVYIDILLAVIVDRMQDYYEDVKDVVVTYVKTKYKAVIRRFKG